MIDPGALVADALRETPPAHRPTLLKGLIAHAAAALQLIAGRQAAYEFVDQLAAAIAATIATHASATDAVVEPSHGGALRSTPLTLENRMRTSQPTRPVSGP